MATVTQESFSAPNQAGDEGAAWFVLRTRSRQELILSNELRAMGVDHCLLLVGRRQRFGAFEAAVRVPLFPQCLFLRGSPRDAQLATRTTRVTDLVRVPDADGLAKELDAVCRAVNAGAPCQVVPLPQAALPARVKGGPLAGLEGAVATPDHNGRILLPMTCLGQAVVVEIEPSVLEVVA